MASKTSKNVKKEARPRSPPDKRLKASEEFSSCLSVEAPQSPTLKGEEVQALLIKQEDLEKLRVPQPPRASQKSRATTHVLVRKTCPPDEVKKIVRVAVARPLPQDTVAEPLDYTGPGGPRFDSNGMVLPHSILGSLRDFKCEMEARGEMELVKRVPDLRREPPLQAGGLRCNEKPRLFPSEQHYIQRHALQHWDRHMTQRRRQQDFISELLQKPVEQLLMTQSSHFRQTQEQRELLSRALPALHSGHGYRVGSEFWSLPQQFGDDLSGITATLTQTERGKPAPVTHISQPQTLRLESGNLLPDQSDSVRRKWDSSVYLQQRRHELRDVLSELDFNQPETDRLEVIGSALPFRSVTVRSSDPLGEEREDQESEREGNDAEPTENEDPLAMYEDIVQEAVLVPALRFCGELASWTDNTAPAHKGDVGICARLTFETVVGQRVCSHVDLENEGSTAIYYSWQRIPQAESFPGVQSHRHTQYFYFNSSTGVILPGDHQRIVFTFKSEGPGVMREVWQLSTHPVLLGGASLQLTLWGVALYQDNTADQRADLELELQQRETWSISRSLVSELLRGVCTPERPGSPAQLYITEEDQFHTNNPTLHYHHRTVEALKDLWECVIRSEVKGSANIESKDTPTEGCIWDLSLESLRQLILTIPKGEPEENGTAGPCLEEALTEYNALILELLKPAPPSPPISLHTVGLQLWRELLDGLGSSALRLRLRLGLPEPHTWAESHSKQEIWEKMKKEERPEKKGVTIVKDEKKGGIPKDKEEKKGTAKPPAKEKPAEDRLGAGKRRVREERRVERELDTSLNSPEDECTQQDLHTTESSLHYRYYTQLHQQVYFLMERLVDSLCDLLDEAWESQPELHRLI
ncbi:MYCBP-associated protein [Chanos chanos]|uniref:MYCBP-associated protein n=1 Tax=Chanos chanos TaxID=29144 RepID=A0A6J2VW67_CHACN|nr:MYCBP-associated protein [Chanos chanos]